MPKRTIKPLYRFTQYLNDIDRIGTGIFDRTRILSKAGIIGNDPKHQQRHGNQKAENKEAEHSKLCLSAFHRIQLLRWGLEQLHPDSLLLIADLGEGGADHQTKDIGHQTHHKGIQVNGLRDSGSLCNRYLTRRND